MFKKILVIAFIAIASLTTSEAKRQKKVDVCHVPPGNPDNAHTINISINAVSAHIGKHGGDYLGPCTSSPTKLPTKRPTPPTHNPTTRSPTKHPTKKPTLRPTRSPTKHPTKKPTLRPTRSPTKHPTKKPTLRPTRSPTDHPTKKPTLRPTRSPTDHPTKKPTECIPGECHSPVDVILLLDSSGSIGINAWNDDIVPSTISLIGAFDVAPDEGIFGVTKFASSSNTIVTLGDSTSSNSVLLVDEINSISYTGGATCMNCALDDAVNIHVPNRRSGIPLVTILMTDGVPTNRPDTVIAATSFNALSDSTLVCIGIGGGVDETFMNSICDSYIHSSSADFSQIQQQIVTEVCDNPC